MCDVDMKKGGSNTSCCITPSGYLLWYFLLFISASISVLFVVCSLKLLFSLSFLCFVLVFVVAFVVFSFVIITTTYNVSKFNFCDCLRRAKWNGLRTKGLTRRQFFKNTSEQMSNDLKRRLKIIKKINPPKTQRYEIRYSRHKIPNGFENFLYYSILFQFFFSWYIFLMNIFIYFWEKLIKFSVK